MTSYLIIFTFLSLVLFPSCHPEQKRSVLKNEILVASGFPIGKIDPFTTGKGLGANLIELIYRPLFRIGRDNEIVPEYAKNVKWKKNRTVLEVTLQNDQMEDVKKTIRESIQNQSSGFGHLRQNLKSIQQTAPDKLEISFNKFDQGILYIFSNLPIVEYSHAEKETGPFRIQEQNDTLVILKRKTPDTYKINKITFKTYPSARRAIRDFVAGSVDFIISADETDFEVLNNLPEIEIAYLNTNLLYKVLKGPKYPNPNDSKSWQKLQYSLLEKKPFEELNHQYISALFPVPKNSPRYDEIEKSVLDIKPDSTPIMDMPQTPLTLNFLDAQGKDQRIALKFKRFLEGKGYKIQLSGLNPSEFEKKVFIDRDFSLALIPYTVKDPVFSNYLVFHTPKGPGSLNISGYSNPKLDAHLEEARYNPDPAEAKEAFSLAMQELMKKPPALFLFWVRTPLVYRKSCRGFDLDADKFFSSLKDVTCEL